MAHMKPYDGDHFPLITEVQSQHLRKWNLKTELINKTVNEKTSSVIVN